MQGKRTVVHITSQAGKKTGNIAEVIKGLHTSRSYLDNIERSILLGPLPLSAEIDSPEILGPNSKVLYSSLNGPVDHPYRGQFEDVQKKFGVGIVYGKRLFNCPGGGQTCAEVILLEVAKPNPHPVNALKAWMYEDFDIESNRYENIWQYDRYVKMAPGALASLRAIAAATPETPGVLIAHDYMGMPTALAAMMDPMCTFKTVFYAHEVATARRIVEEYPGHDTMFYNAMNEAAARQYYLPEVFGPQDFYYKHPLINAARHCDGIMAISGPVENELRFLSPAFKHAKIDLAYSGLAAQQISLKEKIDSKEKLQKYTHNLLDYQPNYVFTHVTRMAPGKGLWRDLRVLENMERQFRSDGRTAVFFLLSTETTPRRHEDIRYMEENWDWPIAHREHAGDLTQTEAAFYTHIQRFNGRCRNIKAVFINQLGWDSYTCGRRMPHDMTFMDIRKGTDCEFGQSIYEPFGANNVEPLTFGGLCVISSVCGCRSLMETVTNGSVPKNIVTADYTCLDDTTADIKSILGIDRNRRDTIEERISARVAHTILDRLPQDDSRAESLIETGYQLARQADWQSICEKYFLPAIENAYTQTRPRRIA